jgi:hypothetical protein
MWGPIIGAVALFVERTSRCKGGQSRSVKFCRSMK